MPTTPSAHFSSRASTLDSQISAHSAARRRAAEEEELLAANDAQLGFEDHLRQPETQASIIQDLLDEADSNVQSEERKGGRQQGAFAWSGPELRALVVSMEAHSVFDPTISADERTQAWLNVMNDINRWNTEHPRIKNKSMKESGGAVRTVAGCDNKWRKHLYPKIVKGETASQIASGAEEDADTFFTSCQQDVAEKRAAARRSKNLDQAKAIDARDRAARSLQQPSRSSSASVPPPASSTTDDASASDSPPSATSTSSDDKPNKRLQPRRSDSASAELTAAVTLMSAQQLEAAATAPEQQQQQHEEQLRQAERARELQRQQHRDHMAREDRRLDLAEKALLRKTEESREVQAMEQKIEALQRSVAESTSMTKELLSLIKSKF
ncbi:hypothetical protein OC861_006456 [Tilletia horrida]|nr:hypothetical protein OC861_006456 [Tilletia horrida]